MDKVAAIGDSADTYYVFVSDNGFFQGQHRIAREVMEVSGLQDIAPTVLALTHEWGSQGDFSIDGMSLLPLAAGRTFSRAQLLESAVTDYLPDRQADQIGAHGSRTTIAWAARSIVTSDGWKYISYPQAGEIELYDLDADPFELNNLGRDPDYDAKQASLEARLSALKLCSGADCWW